MACAYCYVPRRAAPTRSRCSPASSRSRSTRRATWLDRASRRSQTRWTRRRGSTTSARTATARSTRGCPTTSGTSSSCSAGCRPPKPRTPPSTSTATCSTGTLLDWDPQGRTRVRFSLMSDAHARLRAGARAHRPHRRAHSVAARPVRLLITLVGPAVRAGRSAPQGAAGDDRPQDSTPTSLDGTLRSAARPESWRRYERCSRARPWAGSALVPNGTAPIRGPRRTGGRDRAQVTCRSPGHAEIRPELVPLEVLLPGRSRATQVLLPRKAADARVRRPTV